MGAGNLITEMRGKGQVLNPGTPEWVLWHTKRERFKRWMKKRYGQITIYFTGKG